MKKPVIVGILLLVGLGILLQSKFVSNVQPLSETTQAPAEETQAVSFAPQLQTPPEGQTLQSISNSLPEETIQPKPKAQIENERTRLVRVILNTQLDQDTRSEALADLMGLKPHALPELTQVASAVIPKSIRDSDSIQFEKSLRIRSLEAIDQLGEDGVKVLPSLIQVHSAHKEAELKFFAGIAISGVREGRPGKMSRFIDKSFDQALTEVSE